MGGGSQARTFCWDLVGRFCTAQNRKTEVFGWVPGQGGVGTGGGAGGGRTGRGVPSAELLMRLPPHARFFLNCPTEKRKFLVGVLGQCGARKGGSGGGGEWGRAGLGAPGVEQEGGEPGRGAGVGAGGLGGVGGWSSAEVLVGELPLTGWSRKGGERGGAGVDPGSVEQEKGGAGGGGEWGRGGWVLLEWSRKGGSREGGRECGAGGLGGVGGWSRAGGFGGGELPKTETRKFLVGVPGQGGAGRD